MSESQNQPHPAEGQLWRNRASERTVRITSIDPLRQDPGSRTLSRRVADTAPSEP